MLPGLRTNRGNFYLRLSKIRRVVTELLGANAFTAREHGTESIKRERKEKSKRMKEKHREGVG